MGRGDKESAEKTLGNCFALQVIVSIVLTTILLIAGPHLLMAFGASENTIDYAASYMNIYAIGTIFVQLTLGMNAYITAQGFAKTAMLSVLIGAMANIVLDPIFIFVFDMGVRGAALATVLSQAASCTWVLSFLFSQKSILRLRKDRMRIEASIIVPSLTLGLAAFIMQVSESVLSVCFNSSLLRYGGDIAVGAMTILTSVMQFALLPLQGLGQGSQPIISYNFGAKNTARVKQAFWLLLRVSVLYSSLLWILIMFVPKIFASLFTNDVALLAYSSKALRIYFAAIALFGIQIACQLTFTALGNTKASISVAIVRKFVLLIPLIYLLPYILPGDKAFSVYMAEPVADFISVCFTATLFAFQFKKALTGLEDISN